MVTLQRDIERLVKNEVATEALMADMQSRLDGLKDAKQDLELAWKAINVHPDLWHMPEYAELKRAVQKVLAV